MNLFLETAQVTKKYIFFIYPSVIIDTFKNLVRLLVRALTLAVRNDNMR